MAMIETSGGAPWPIDGVARVALRTDSGAQRSSSAATSANASGVAASATLDAGSPPINAERVAQLRKAIEEGRYPVIPMRVADALIAAGLILRSGK